ncbi:MAG: hypothetical protein J1E84_06735 [Muribaculaceae bacterium]|nr:hypothetical protein [Muribaculaceae bacterium]
MRKFILACLIGTACATFAAPPVFNVKTPNWSKIAISTTNGLNVRKSPSTTAPRLMYDEMNIEAYDLPVIYSAKWVAKPTRYMVAITFDSPMPIVSEKDGWFEVLNCGPSYKENGWISGKFAKAVDYQPMSVSNNPNSRYAWIDRGDDGTYMIDLEFDEMNGEATFHVGRLVNGVVVSPYVLYCPFVNYDNTKKPSLGRVNGEYEFTYNKTVSSDDYEYDPLASKLSKELLDEVIKNAVPADIDRIYFMYNGDIYTTN